MWLTEKLIQLTCYGGRQDQKDTSDPDHCAFMGVPEQRL